MTYSAYRATYNNIGGPQGHLAWLEEFTGNTMQAHFAYERHANTTVYKVYSYSTLMAIYDPSDGTLYYNDSTYSVTTSRQQTLIRAWLAHSLWAEGTRGPRYYVDCNGPDMIYRALYQNHDSLTTVK